MTDMPGVLALNYVVATTAGFQPAVSRSEVTLIFTTDENHLYRGTSDPSIETRKGLRLTGEVARIFTTGNVFGDAACSASKLEQQRWNQASNGERSTGV